MQNQKKPLYRRKWFIALIILAAIGVIGNLGNSDTDTANETAPTTQVVEQTAEAIPEPVAEKPEDASCKVVRVVDGDTIVVDLNGTQEKVRLIGIDTPESVHPDASRNVEYGSVASAFTKSQLEGQSVTLEMDVQERDQYGRILAYVYIGGKMFNKTLLEEGHAQVATYPPNVKYVDDFLAIQKQAQAEKVGLWAIEPFGEDKPAAPSVTATAPSASTPEAIYTGNKNTRKFHYSSCHHAGRISPHNVIYFNTREEAVSGGYVPCKVCKP